MYITSVCNERTRVKYERLKISQIWILTYFPESLPMGKLPKSGDYTVVVYEHR